MSQIQTSNWSQTAASNNAASPNGMPEGMAPSGVNDSIRELMSALKIDWANVHGVDSSGALLSTAGTSTAYTLTFSTAPASLYTSFIFGCKIHTDCGADPTINVNGLGVVNIQKMTASGYANLGVSDLKQNQHPLFKYDGTLAKVILLMPTAGLSGDPMTTRGDIIVRNSSNVTARLAVGAAARLLRSDGTDISWAQVAGATDISGTIPSGNLPAATTSASGIAQLADAAAMEAKTASRVSTADIQHRHPAHPKAWCTWVGSTAGTNPPLAGEGVSTVQRTAAGSYVITFSVAFSSANYCMTHAHMDATSNATGQYLKIVSKTASTCTVRFNVNGAATDVDEVHAAFFGDHL